jgi:tetratricopeptide (TPR) repeat protein
MPQVQSSGDINALLHEASVLEKNAADRDEILRIIDVYKEVEKIDPQNYQALWKIGNYYLLLGAAHSPGKKAKSKHYKDAVKYCEKAMFTNPKFRDAVLAGNDIPDAASLLSMNEIDAMGYWYTARFYYFKDCLSPLRRVFNTSIVIENNKMIDYIDKLDPNWAGGGNYFSRALYYIALPERFGGSKELAEQEFAKAIEAGPNYIVNRWGRAKYLYSLTGNTEGYLSDLQWVVQQNPQTAANPNTWNVYFIQDAIKMLADTQK